MDSRSINKVSSGGNHGDAAVLELGGAEPEKGLITPPSGEAKGVEVGEGEGGATDVIKANGDLGTRALLSEKEIG